MSKNKNRRMFRVRPASTQSGIADLSYFASHPEEKVYLRPVIAGEFTDVALPNNLNIDDVRFVLVRRLPYWQGQERIPLSLEMAKSLQDPNYWKKISGE